MDDPAGRREAEKTSDLFQRLREEMTRPPFNRFVVATPVAVDAEKREIEIALPFRPEFSGDPTTPFFHGGMVATLIDIAGHAAVAVWHGGQAPTINLQIDYLAPAIGTELRARGILRRLGRSISRADVEVTAAGKLVAIGRGTFSTSEKTR